MVEVFFNERTSGDELQDVQCLVDTHADRLRCVGTLPPGNQVIGWTQNLRNTGTTVVSDRDRQSNKKQFMHRGQF